MTVCSHQHSVILFTSIKFLITAINSFIAVRNPDLTSMVWIFFIQNRTRDYEQSPLAIISTNGYFYNSLMRLHL